MCVTIPEKYKHLKCLLSYCAANLQAHNVVLITPA